MNASKVREKEKAWLKEKLKEWEEEDERAKRVRETSADWDYIDRVPKNVRKALKLFIECGDLIKAAREYDIPYTEFNSYRIKAGIPLLV